MRFAIGASPERRSALHRGVLAGMGLVLPMVLCATAAAGTPPDACNLLNNAEVHSLAPSLGEARPGTVKIKNVSSCEWPDAHGMPGLMLQVAPAPSHSLRDDLASGIAAMGGYDIENVPGVGDEAAMAVQQANPQYGLKAGVAILSVRVGKRVVSLSPVRVVVKPGTAKFAGLKQLAAKAASQL
jgi:hypothetical protein